MRVIVLGAGVVGVTSAWFLAEAGHEVVVVDRQPGPALETSFANGGQISTSHAEPWANPQAPAKILRWLLREDAPLLWRLRADAAQWAWGLRFLGQCTAARTRANIIAILALALDSRARLGELRAELDLQYDHLERGILHVYTDSREFAAAIPQAALMREFGCERTVQSAAECLSIEPALRDSALPIVGGTYTAGDESGDACRFTQQLADRCAARGVAFRFSTEVAALEVQGDRLAGVCLASGEKLSADAFVVALGSYSPRLLKPVGVSIPVYPAKGYSVTVALDEQSMAPSVSLTDDAAKLVFSRLGQRLRVAGTAEFNGWDTSINHRRCDAIVQRAFTLFPHAGRRDGIEYWAGLRPATPGNVPLVGAARYPNLFVNTGHGTLGWTLACGSGKLLADLVSAVSPAVDPTPYAV